QHFAERQLVDLVEVPDFGRAKGMQVHRRKSASQIGQKLLVPFQLQGGMHAALHEDLVAAEGDGFLDLLVEFLARQNVGIGIGGLPEKGTEIADGGADVGVVDVAVDLVGAIGLRVEAKADGMGSAAELVDVAALKERGAFVGSQAFTGDGFRENAVDHPTLQ